VVLFAKTANAIGLLPEKRDTGNLQPFTGNLWAYIFSPEPELSLASLDTPSPVEKADSELLPEDWGRLDKWDSS
jgi:hypothetical protein